MSSVPSSHNPCEVPEVSLLVEEGVCVESPRRKPNRIANTDALPRTPPYRPAPTAIFTSPPTQSLPYDPYRYRQKPLPQSSTNPLQQCPSASHSTYSDGSTTPCCVQKLSPSSQSRVESVEKDYTRLEALIERLLSQSLETSRMSTTSSTSNTTMASVATNTSIVFTPHVISDKNPPPTSIDEGRASVACNTSLHWPTLSSIGLAKPNPVKALPEFESIGTQCEKDDKSSEHSFGRS